MPELPEVQTIINDLNRKIKGDTIVSFWSDWPKAIKGLGLGAFKKDIANRKIIGARRIGKNIFIDLNGEKTLYVHLKMTGHLLIKQFNIKFLIPNFQKNKLGVKEGGKNYFDDRVNQYIHHIFYLKSGKTLEFSDLRKFGKIVLDDTSKINELPEVRKLGIDVLSEKFNFNVFQKILDRRKNRPIGIVLMEQELLSGIGNIYRSEILFEAGILPQRKVESLSLSEKRRIFTAIAKILRKAIKLRGTSDSDYRDTSGAPGEFQKVLKVYRREGEKCLKCGAIIKRAKIGQRSVFYCPYCQI